MVSDVPSPISRMVIARPSACGTPVIAFGKGGVLETVCGLDHPQPTGVFYDAQTVSSLVAAVGEFEAAQHRITPHACRANAERFSGERFEQEMKNFVESRLAAARLARQPSQYKMPQASPILVSSDLTARVVPIKSV